MKRALAVLFGLVLVVLAAFWIGRAGDSASDLAPASSNRADAATLEAGRDARVADDATARSPAALDTSPGSRSRLEVRVRSNHGLALSRVLYRTEGDVEWAEGRLAEDGTWSRPTRSRYEVQAPGHVAVVIPPDVDEAWLEADALFVLCGPSLREVVRTWNVGVGWLPEEMQGRVLEGVSSGWIGPEEFAIAADTSAEWFARDLGEVELELLIAPRTHVRVELRPTRGMRERHCLEGEPQWGMKHRTADLEVAVTRGSGRNPCVLELWSAPEVDDHERSRHETLGEWGVVRTGRVASRRSTLLMGSEQAAVFEDVALGERFAVAGVDAKTGDHDREFFRHTGVPQSLSLSGGVQLVGRVVCADSCPDAHEPTALLLDGDDGQHFLWCGPLTLRLDEQARFRWVIPNQVPHSEGATLPMTRNVSVLFRLDGHATIRRELVLPASGEMVLADLVFEARWATWRLPEQAVGDLDRLRYQRVRRSDESRASFELHRAKRTGDGWVQFSLTPSDEHSDRVVGRNEHGREVDLDWREDVAAQLLVSTPEGGILAFEHASGTDYRAVDRMQQSLEFLWSEEAAALGSTITWGIEWFGIRMQLGGESPPPNSLSRTRHVQVPTTGVRYWAEIGPPGGVLEMWEFQPEQGETVTWRAD